MRIIIETTGSEQIAIRPEDPLVASRGATSSAEVAAIDGGPPHEELLQALGERTSALPAKSTAARKEPYAMSATGGGPSPSWH